MSFRNSAKFDDEDHLPLIGEATKEMEVNKKPDPYRQKMLIISFLMLVVVGLGNKIFQKLQTIPMHNYPYFLSLFVTFVYIPLSFAYILPMMYFGKNISSEQRAIPWYKFAVMGTLDGIAAVMQTFAVNYIPSGSLIILLSQAAIPISMVITKVMLKAKYGLHNYFGAFVVVCGLVVVLLPNFIHPQPQPPGSESNLMITIWCGVMILSCVPMTLSSVYKEKALGETEIDVVYMNGWVAVYQFIISVAMAVPSAYASNLTPRQLPENLLNGAKCYIGINSITAPGKDIHLDNCTLGPLFVSLYLGFNVCYNVLIIMILKYGSSNILWLAMTIMVPLGNFAFALPFIPDRQALTVWNDIGLGLILAGLIVYRFYTLFAEFIQRRRNRTRTLN